jgi:hypothetical protein
MDMAFGRRGAGDGGRARYCGSSAGLKMPLQPVRRLKNGPNLPNPLYQDEIVENSLIISENLARNGGFGSGRHSRSPDGRKRADTRYQYTSPAKNMVPGDQTFGGLAWYDIATGEKVASIGFEACLLNPEAAWARLYYSANGRPEDYRVRLVTSPCHYGGHRWWWICPRSGWRVAKLYLPPGATVLPHGRTIGCHTEANVKPRSIGRTIDRGGSTGSLARNTSISSKLLRGGQRGMHRVTYQRLTAQLHDGIEAHDEVFAIGASAILARMMRK